MSKVLVTGAGGFIGSHLVERLVADGADVRAFVEYDSRGSWGWLDSASADVLGAVEIIAGDIRDSHAVRQAVSGCETVFHLAALIGIPYSYLAPESYVDTNVTGTLNVVQAATDLGVMRVVHTSTSEVYGTAQYVPIDEAHPLNPQSPYAATKVGADQIALSYGRSFGTPVTVVRPFNTYGPRQSARAVIPTIITQLAAHDRRTGAARIRLGATAPTRDFTFVADTVDGFLAAARTDAAQGDVVNIGTNFEISIGDTARTIAEVMDVEIEIETEDTRLRPDASEVERLWCDNRRAAEVIGWQPSHAGLEGFRRGLEKTVDWFAAPSNRAGYKAHIYNV
ncbi:MAG: SDR family NAD(P)-dependent oxidoreductase [Alphaproteobacteria bacterium]|nr:SDR family NAD(P)-dependent oxidoreductase [Alphaproteobacteria bacterium]